MRRAGAVMAAALLALPPAAPASAHAAGPQEVRVAAPEEAHAAGPQKARAAAPQEVCKITDPAVTEASGLAVLPGGGYLVENDSNPEPRKTRLFYLGADCSVTRSVGYPTTARDPEDLAVDRNGTVWIADIGDNSPLTGGSGQRRTTIALWTLAPGAKSPKIHRLRYPDGVPRDAEALLIDGQGRPVIVTKDPGGEVFRLDTPLPNDNAEGAPLTKVGTFEPPASSTENPWGVIGTGFITGAAVSPDGRHAVIRTYADAFEFEVADGDVAKAITSGTKASVTPLPNEPQGEAIAYTPDGSAFLTVSDEAGPSTILRYTIRRENQPSARASSSGPPAAVSSAPSSTPEVTDRRARVALLVGAFVVVGLALVGGVAMWVRRRRR